MYNDYVSEREIYNNETYSLFSHRPDVKAKRNYISSTPKRKRDVDDGELISMFLMAITLFVMACTIAIV